MSRHTRRRVGIAAIIVFSWTLIAFAWAPPTYLVQPSGGRLPFATILLFVLLGFVPWMLVTPAILWFSRRFPVSEPRTARNLGLQVIAGVVLVPATTVCGILLANTAVSAAPLWQQPGALTAQAEITAFYSIPTYIAVAGIGHALAWFERYRTRDRLLARAELRALESQLNPHFLFNALNAVAALGYRDPKLADRAIAHLSGLLRSTLRARPQEIALKEEIAFANEFFDLYALITPKQIRANWSVEPGAWKAAIPPLLLQPLLENAIAHGVARLTTGGTISIAVRRLGEFLQIGIENDAPASDGQSSGAGIGLANVRERLRVLYADRACLEFVREPEKARMTVELPFREIEP